MAAGLGGDPGGDLGAGGGSGAGGGGGSGAGGGGPVARNLSRQADLATTLERADSLWAKFLGLMGRPSLAPGGGLWLPDSNGIHMMFMRFPIDAVFVGRDVAGVRQVVALHRSLRPWTGLVPFVRGAHGVLEFPAGTIDATGTQVGDLIELAAAS